MKQNNLDWLQQSIADTIKAIHTQLDESPNESTPLRQRLTRLLRDLNTYLQSEQTPPDHLRPESEGQYHLLFEAIDEGVCIIEVIFDENQNPVDYLFVEVNPAFERHTGIKNAVGKRVRDFVPAHETYWFEIYGKVALTGEPIRFENAAEQLHRYYDVFAFRVGDPSEHTVAVIFNDISERRNHELNSSFLSDISQQLVTLSTPDEIIKTLGEKLHQFLGATVVAFIQINESKDLAVISNDWHSTNDYSLIGQYNLTIYVTDEYRKAMSEGQITVVRDVAKDIHIKDKERFSDLKIGSFINVPLIRDGEWKFTAGIYHDHPYDWRDDQIELMLAVTNRIWNKLERIHSDNVLRESEEKYRSLFNSMDEGYILMEVKFDEQGSPVDIFYLDANAAAVRMTGAELVGKSIRQINPHIEPSWLAVYGRVVKTGVSERHEFHAVPPEKWFSIYAYKVGGAESQQVATIYQDITDRKRAESAAQQEAALDAYRVTLMDALQPLTNIAEIRLAATRVLGQQLGANRVHYAEISDDDQEIIIDQGYTYDIPSLTGRYDFNVLDPEFAEMLRSGRLLVISDTQQAADLPAAAREAYSQMQIGAYIAVPLVKGGRLAAGLAVHQKEPREWTAEEVRFVTETADRVWSAVTYARNAQHAQELAVIENRQQLARDLHDSVTQTLFSASILTQASVRQYNRDPEKMTQRLREIDKQVRGAMGEMRALLLELRPDNVQTTVFSQLLKNLIDGVHSRRRIEITLSFDDEPTLPPEVRLGVYRIAQEVINNITKHSNASQAWVTGKGGNGYIELNFRDNGVGFSTTAPVKGMGLQIMRERAEAINAQLVINSVLGEGTEVQIRWAQDSP